MRSGLPFYYRKLAGNIPDVKTIQNLLADLKYLGCQKIKLVMDRGFYSEDNVNALYRDHLKFILATKLNLTYVKKELDKIRPNKGDQIRQDRRLYLHLYFNSIDEAKKNYGYFALVSNDIKKWNLSH
ncbi:MAG: transposase [Clostridiaceae bacterium]|nr:transposase [Clostridiaceae bacterium]